MIKISNLCFKYKNGLNIFNNLNLDINEGEFICFIGKNGSGKSSLMNLISGILKPTSGDVLVDDINTKVKKDFINLRKKIGIVFQNPENQLIFNNVYDDISFGLNNLNLDDVDSRIDFALKNVSMSEFKNKDTYELSLGQKQRIAIASVLAVKPKYIVFDEPTTMIDSSGKDDIYNIFKNLKEQGFTIILTTNLIDEILLSDRIVILEDGCVIADFKKENIFQNLHHFYNNNLKVPEIITIIKKLKENNINIPCENFSIEYIIDYLIDVIRGKSK